MMHTQAAYDGLMKGLQFHEEDTQGNGETILFEVRRCRGGMELHITHTTYNKGKRPNTRRMLHAYTPEPYGELAELIASANIPAPEVR